MRRIAISIYLLVLTGCWPRPTSSVSESLPVVDPPVPLPVQSASAVTPPASPYRAQPVPPPQPAPPLPAPHVAPDPEPPPPPSPLPPPVQKVAHTLPTEEETPASATLPDPPPRLRQAREPAVVDALRCLLDKRPADAVVPLEKLDKPTQDLLLRFLPLIARLNDGNLEKSDPEELALVANQLEEVVRTLRPRSALVIEQMCFCRRIENFGQYDPLPPDYRFRPGEMVLVYVELENLSSRLVDGLYETRLASSVEIVDDQGRTAWRKDLKDRDQPDRSRSLRNDYCNGYRFFIPENIPPGDYRLVVRVADLHAPERKPAERSLVLRVTTRPLHRPLAESARNQ